MDKPKLNDLAPKDQAEIVARRIEETKLLQEHAIKTGDPLALMACELDAQARRMGVNIEYSEQLDDEEIP